MAGLIADIGATKARFARVDADSDTDADAIASWGAATAGFADVESALAAACGALGCPRPDAVVLAVAGPVRDGRAELTNAHWTFDAARLAAALAAPVRLVNDFAALAAGVADLAAGDLHRIGPAALASDPGQPRLVLGPGSGLGVAALLPDGDRWRVVESEAGHAAFAPEDALERELLAVLAGRLGRVDNENLLSGPGLTHLHGAMAALWGLDDAPPCSAPDITAAALAGDPLCHQTVSTFCAMLGAVAGNLALTFCARGGVWLAGGIPPRILPLLEQGEFRRRFEDRGLLAGLARAIPTDVIVHPEPGLHGAACLLRRLLQ